MTFCLIVETEVVYMLTNDLIFESSLSSVKFWFNTITSSVLSWMIVRLNIGEIADISEIYKIRNKVIKQNRLKRSTIPITIHPFYNFYFNIKLSATT